MKGLSVIKSFCLVFVIVFAIATLNGPVMAQIYYDASGKVGIGTKIPAEKLDVAGGLRLGNTSSANKGTIRWTGSKFEGYDGSSWLNLGGGVNSLWTDSGSYIYANNATNVAITDSGNVGIGTAGPTQRLEIAGKLKLTGIGNGIIFLDGTEQNTASGNSLWSLNGTSAYYSKSGNVGIGTTSPAEKLDVAGGLKLDNTNSKNKGTIRWTGKDFEGYNGSSWLSLTGGGGGNSDGHSLDAADGDPVDAVYVDGEGRVGIGTASPSREVWLDVAASARIFGPQSNLIFDDNGPLNQFSEILFRRSGVNKGVFRYDHADGNMKFFVGDTDNVDIAITPGGNVGIGTQSPSARLEIVGGSIKLNSPSVAEFIFANSSTGKNWTLGTGWGTLGTQTFYFDYAGTQPMVIKDGNVGINTTDPGSYKLYVNGSAYSTGGWAGSDVRWKKNITPLGDSLGKVSKLQGVNYEWKTEEYPDQGFTEGNQIGLIAQEVEKVIPELVNTNNDGYKSISYEKLTAVLVEAVKELKKQNEEQKAQNEALKAYIEALQVRIEALESR